MAVCASSVIHLFYHGDCRTFAASSGRAQQRRLPRLRRPCDDARQKRLLWIRIQTTTAKSPWPRRRKKCGRRRSTVQQPRRRYRCKRPSMGTENLRRSDRRWRKVRCSSNHRKCAFSPTNTEEKVEDDHWGGSDDYGAITESQENRRGTDAEAGDTENPQGQLLPNDEPGGPARTGHGRVSNRRPRVYIS